MAFLILHTFIMFLFCIQQHLVIVLINDLNCFCTRNLNKAIYMLPKSLSLFISFLTSLVFFNLFLGCLLLSLLFLCLSLIIKLLLLFLLFFSPLKRLTFCSMVSFYMSFNVVSTSCIFTLVAHNLFMYS